jgi:CPA1 family monovalent cation:H+ antiporter
VRTFEIVLVLVLVAALVEPVARRLDVPLAIAQVLCGLALAALPSMPALDIDPELSFSLLVPPLLYRAAATSSVRDTRRNASPILLLAVVLVLITMAAVALVAHAAAGMPFGPALVLGAMVSPPDADVTTAIARRLGLPARLVTILEGETLFNDATAFVSYRAAVAAVVVGTFSPAETALRLVAVVAGGAATGLALGHLATRLRRRLANPVVESTVSLLTPFATYVLAERVGGGSGVLAVVVLGLYVSRFLPRAVPLARVRGYPLWETVSFAIGGLVFVLIGLQLGRVAPVFWRGGDLALTRLAALVSVTAIATRLLYVFASTCATRFVARTASRGAAPSWRAVAVVAWAGLRGGDTLVMSLAVPMTTAAGLPFPARESVVAAAYGVILVTLVAQGLTLRPIIRRLELRRDDTVEVEERRARRAAVRAALERIAELEAESHAAEEPGAPHGRRDAALDDVRRLIAHRARLDADEILHAAGGHDGSTTADRVRRAEREARDAARRAIVRLRDDGEIGDEALRRVERDLDFDDVRSDDGAAPVVAPARTR